MASASSHAHIHLYYLVQNVQSITIMDPSKYKKQHESIHFEFYQYVAILAWK
jgi:hypothetical protein